MPPPPPVSSGAPSAFSPHPPLIEGGALEWETDEDFRFRDNDLIKNPDSPHYTKLLLSAYTCGAFKTPVEQAAALSSL